MKIKRQDLRIECQDLEIGHQEMTVQSRKHTTYVLRHTVTRSQFGARRLKLRLSRFKKQLGKRDDDAAFGRRTLERLKQWKGVSFKDCKNMLIMDTVDIDEEAAAEESDLEAEHESTQEGVEGLLSG